MLKKVKYRYWGWVNYAFKTYEGVSSLILFLFNPVFFVVKSLSVGSSFTNLLKNKKM